MQQPNLGDSVNYSTNSYGGPARRQAQLWALENTTKSKIQKNPSPPGASKWTQGRGE